MVPPENKDSLLTRAYEDLRAAEILRKEDDELTTTICFHIQQYVEKMVKAKLDEMGIPYPSKHNILTLLNLFPEKDLASKLFDEASALTDYATSARYDAVAPTVKQINAAFEQANRIIEAISGIKNE